MAEKKPDSLDDEEPISLVGDEDDEPISLVEGEAKPSGVRAIGSAAVERSRRQVQFKRSLNLTGQGATRCRIFHSRIALAPLDHLESQINEWIDDEGIEVKHAGHVVGVMEGKTPEPNVIVLVWY